jgi:hypothetical protein
MKLRSSLGPDAGVPERERFEVRVSGPARRDLISILKLSRKEFGEAATLRYAALMAPALRDIGEDPEGVGDAEFHKRGWWPHVLMSRKSLLAAPVPRASWKQHTGFLFPEGSVKIGKFRDIAA